MITSLKFLKLKAQIDEAWVGIFRSYGPQMNSELRADAIMAYKMFCVAWAGAVADKSLASSCLSLKLRI